MNAVNKETHKEQPQQNPSKYAKTFEKKNQTNKKTFQLNNVGQPTSDTVVVWFCVFCSPGVTCVYIIHSPNLMSWLVTRSDSCLWTFLRPQNPSNWHTLTNSLVFNACVQWKKERKVKALIWVNNIHVFTRIYINCYCYWLMNTFQSVMADSERSSFFVLWQDIVVKR